MTKVTAGRDELNAFAPKFAELNDDILFGEIWAREDKLSARDRSIVTVTVLMASGILDNSLKFHMQNAKKLRRNQRRNFGDFNARCFLRRLAKGMGGLSNGKRSLGRKQIKNTCGNV